MSTPAQTRLAPRNNDQFSKPLSRLRFDDRAAFRSHHLKVGRVTKWCDSRETRRARTRQEVQDILRIQREQNRLGGLLKKALTERAEKTGLRRTLIEVERSEAELRLVIAHLVRSR